jgi:hypothetical protein
MEGWLVNRGWVSVQPENESYGAYQKDSVLVHVQLGEVQ